MTMKKPETVLRLLIGLALGAGFVGFATHRQPVVAETPALVAEAPSAVEL